MTTVREPPPKGTSGEREAREAEYRYGFVFLLTLGLLVFVILSPSRDWSRAVALTLQFITLLVVVSTSRAARDMRRSIVTAVLIAAIACVLLESTDELSQTVQLAISGLLSAAIPLALIGGLVGLVRSRGVTLQAVAGALALYLLVGLVFAWVIGFASKVSSTSYFAQQPNPSVSQVVYFSFTTITTTGYGDLSPAARVGRALSVVEMLLGQLYLVTVIGVLVGNFARRPGQSQ